MLKAQGLRKENGKRAAADFGVVLVRFKEVATHLIRAGIQREALRMMQQKMGERSSSGGDTYFWVSHTRQSSYDSTFKRSLQTPKWLQSGKSTSACVTTPESSGQKRKSVAESKPKRGVFETHRALQAILRCTRWVWGADLRSKGNTYAETAHSNRSPPAVHTQINSMQEPIECSTALEVPNHESMFCRFHCAM